MPARPGRPRRTCRTCAAAWNWRPKRATRGVTRSARGSSRGGAPRRDLPHLRRCVELAAEAVDAGDHPFGSVLVAGDGRVLAEDRNRENTMGDATRHPEFELARWAAANMTAADRATATAVTSGGAHPPCA